MPFTLAHPAAAVPLKKPLGKLGVLSALVIGSMAPDFAYFLPEAITRFNSHSLIAVFWFCIPLGLVAYCIFHLLLAPVLVSLLPGPVRARLPARLSLGLPPDAPLIGVAVSLLIGTVTHLGWDLLTHATSPLVASSPLLGMCLLEVSGCQIHVYKVLQHGSTLTGFALLLWLINRWYRATGPINDAGGRRAPATLRIMSMLLLVLVPAFVGAWSALGHLDGGHWSVQLRQSVGHSVRATGASFWVTWFALGLAYWIVPLLSRSTAD